MRHVDYLQIVQDWVADRASELRESGTEVTVKVSELSSSKPSVSICVEKLDDAVFVTVWNSGEAQISSINYSQEAEPKEEYRHVESPESLVEALKAVLERFV